MNKLARFALIAPLFLLLACERVSFSSYLDVNKKFTIKSKKGESIQFDPGRIHIDLTVKNKRSVNINIYSKKKQDITFSIPSSAHFPSERGSFFISAEDLKQDFDLDGEIATTYFDTPSITSTEICQYPVTRQVCRQVSNQVVCTTETNYEQGERTIVTHYEERESRLILEFKEQGTSEVIAKFDGTHVSHERQLVDIYGECLVRH